MTPFRRLLSYFRPYKRALTLGGLSVIGSSVFSLAKPMIVGKAVDALTHHPVRSALIQYALLYVGASVVQGVFLYLQRWIVIGASRDIEFDMRRDFYNHLQTLPSKFYNEQRTGDLMSRATNDLASVRMLVGPAVMHAFSSLLVVGGAFFMMLRINQGLALIALIAVPVVAGAVKHFGEKIHVKSKEVQDYFGEISARVQENLSGVRVVRAFTQEENEVGRFHDMNEEFVTRNRSLIKLSATFYPVLHGVIGTMFVIVFFFGSRRMLAGTMTVGEFVAFNFYLGRMIWPLIALGWVINLFQRGMASMKRMSEVWDIAPPGDAAEKSYDRSVLLEPEIVISHLTFAYTNHDVLKDVSLQIAPGQTIGIVGRTGSGKSTLLALLSRYFEAPPGTIFIGGRPIEAISLHDLRQMIGMVPQETFLFSETIAENIRFGRAEASTDEVTRVAALAGLGDDLTGFTDGLETVIGERGITLSGGQKQRTAIARAIIRDPAILILDDALSAVDTSTEERILGALRDVRRGRTVLIVSHRVSSVKDADRIVVLDEGRVVEQGTHEELIGRDGYYADLYRRQTLEEEIAEIA